MGDVAQAQSIVQQAYQYIFDQIVQIPQSDVFENWLSEMVAYYAVITVREIQPDAFAGAEDQTYRLEDDDMAITEPLQDAEISTTFTQDEVDTMTTQILSELTEAEKICVIMHYQENQSVAQVAKTVGCTEQATESLIASGKRKIQDAIGHGFMHTLAAKIFIGVAAVAVVGGTAAGIVAHNHSHKEPDATTVASTEAVEVCATEETTENTTESTTEEVTAEEAVDESYKAVYLQILQDHEANIKAYSQYRQTLGVDEFASDNENMSNMMR